jgi:hypothetical protein
MLLSDGCEILNYLPNLVLTGTPAFTYFIEATSLSIAQMKWGSISGGATGVRYYCDMNSVINTQGSGTSYLPGNAAGITATGGQYI